MGPTITDMMSPAITDPRASPAITDPDRRRAITNQPAFTYCPVIANESESGHQSWVQPSLMRPAITDPAITNAPGHH